MALPRKQKITLFILIGLTTFYFVVEFYMWFATKGMPAMMDQTEPFTTYLAAKNFVRFGITNLSFLEDYATSPAPEAHPYHYTHNPDFPIYICYILLKLGIKDIAYHNLVGIFVLYIGLMFSYLFVKQRCNTNLALCLLGVSIFNYLGVLVYGLNVYRSFTWFCIWGVLYFKHRWEESGASLNFKLLWALLFMFLAAYYDYGITAFVILFVFFDKLLCWKRLPLYKLVLYLFVSVVPAILLHSISVINAVGLNTYCEDILNTIGNRFYGVPTRSEISEFYKINNMVLWGYDWGTKINFVEYTKYALNLMHQRVSSFIGFGIGELVIFLTLFSVFVLFFNHIKVFIHKNKYLNEKKLLLAFIFSIGTLASVFQTHFTQLYINAFVPLIVFPCLFSVAIVLSYLIRNSISSYRKNTHYYRFMLGTILIYLLLLQIIHIHKERIRPLPFSSVLSKYKGYSFYSNYLSTVTSYFTESWSGTNWDRANEQYFDSKFVWEANKSKFSSKDKYCFPDYVLLYKSINAEPMVDDLFYDKYRVVAKTKDYIIFDVRTRNYHLAPSVLELGEKEDYKIEGGDFPPISKIVSSSMLNGCGPQNLNDGNSNTIWHREIHTQPGSTTGPASIVVDFGEQMEYAINIFCALPRADAPKQFFKDAILEGSKNNECWVGIAEIKQKLCPNGDKWLSWYFDNKEKYRFYKVTFPTGHEEGARFYSLSEIRLGIVSKMPVIVNSL
ncbi:MAG: discoidin domain-containing protein [Candidatus Brocadia sp.]|nr:discoidin domain-containing protein [Candidatus Brocadia sp.]